MKANGPGIGGILGAEILALGILLLGLTSASCMEKASTGADPDSRRDQTRKEAVLVARGERLVVLVGCDGCHTPQISGPSVTQPDYSRRLSGHPATGQSLSDTEHPWESLILPTSPNTVFASPWGDRYASNLTPDRETGIGTWTETVFVDRMIESQHWLYYSRSKSFLIQSGYNNLTDRDWKSIFAYLGSLPPIENRVPDTRSAGDWMWQ